MVEKNNFMPAVSIIMPMYNSEKYIAECLESIFSQTFQNFELIIVDDCSTDRSRDVVVNYVVGDMVKKVKLIGLTENAGNPAIPRNIGLKAAQGEYVMFVDSDDVLTPTALEELYTTAKELDADFMSCRLFHMFYGETWKNATKIKLRGTKIDKPVQVADPLLSYSKRQFAPMVWVCFIRREIIAKNNIEFPHIPMTEDTFFVFFCLYYSKRVFRIPNLYYHYRKHPDSIQTTKIGDIKFMDIRVESVVRGFKIFEDFDRQHKIFDDRPDVKYATLRRMMIDIMSPADNRKVNQKISVQEFNEIIQKALQKIDDKDFLTTFLFSYSTNLRVNINEKNETIKKLQEENQKLQEKIQKAVEQLQN